MLDAKGETLQDKTCLPFMHEQERGCSWSIKKKIVLNNGWIFIADEAKKRNVLWFRGEK